MEKLMKILRYGWMYVIVAVFIISVSGCTEEKKADIPAEEPATEECQKEAPNPEATEAATPADAVEGSESDAAESEADPGVRDIPVKGAK